MKYEKGSFLVIPNKEKLKETDAISQSIFFWICDFSDKNGQCYPSINTLARLSRVCKNTVKKRIARLEEMGFVKKTIRKSCDGKNYSNLYQILIIKNKKSNRSADDPYGANDAQTTGQEIATNSTKIKLNPSKIKGIYKLQEKVERSSVNYLEKIPADDMAELVSKYKVSEQFILRKIDDLINYCKTTGKTYENYNAALRIFIKNHRESQKGNNNQTKFSNYIPVTPGKYDKFCK
ncbi:MAG: helix-turn-helix domain-containing protein [Candidatus Paceibacterota bacterium]